MTAPHAVVFDCNVFLQIMLSAHGPAYACWQKVLAGEVTLCVTPKMLLEIRRLPQHRNLKRFRHFTPDRVERFIEDLLKVCELTTDPAPSFIYSRDPDDARYVDAAIATKAMLIVSRDKDLLDLMNDANPAGKALRAQHLDFRVLTPPQLAADERS